jgi:hypothetical protein
MKSAVDMYHYAGFGLTIHSEMQLPELPLGGPDADLVIRLGQVPRPVRTSSMQEEFAFPEGLAGFHISNGRDITVEPLPSADSTVLRNVLLGRIMSFVMRQRGWLPLHASVVELHGVAALFLGLSGAGKSTTAAAFHLAGHSLVADDLGAVRVTNGRCEVQPGIGRLRLMSDALDSLRDLPRPICPAVGKCSVYVGGLLLERAIPVKRIYLLDYADALRLEPLSPQYAAMLFDGNSFFKKQRMDRRTIETQFERCAAVAAVTPVRRLLRTRALALLPALVKLVEKDLAQ